jgi:hypothetical protein
MVSAMSGDRKGGAVRRPRPIGRPRVQPGPLADLKDLIYRLYLRARTPTLDEITAAVASDNDLVGCPGRDTIGRVIGDPGLPPSHDDVVAVVTVLARAAGSDSGDAAGRAVDLWIEARMASARIPLAAVKVSQADPQRLGVHPAISVPGVADALPPEYVPRDADGGESGVRARVTAAAGRGGFTLLVGGSSVGKTRSAFEAVTALLPEWWLVHPAGPGEVTELAGAPPPRTVVWLDELQRYLDGEDGLTAATLRALLNAPHPLVIIGTLWPEYYTAYTAMPGSGGSDPHLRKRDLLSLADVVRIDPEFSLPEEDRARAAAARDPRLAVALETAGYGLPQTLAAAPQLVARWRDAKTAAPYGWAVLTAALDAARLGAHAPLSADLLRAAAPGYCTSRQQAEAPDNWFEQALAYATGKLHGAAAALSPAGAGMGKVNGYVAADYLIQHASRERRDVRVPASTWDAVISHVHDPADSVKLGDSGNHRLLYCYAIPLYQRAAAAGDEHAAKRLAMLLAARGDMDGAADILRAPSDVGGGPAAWRLASMLSDSAQIDRLRALADSGDTAATWGLAAQQAENGDLARAAQILRSTAGDDGQRAAVRLADMLADYGDSEGLRARADAGDQLAVMLMPDLIARRRQLEARARTDTDDREVPAVTGDSWIHLQFDPDQWAGRSVEPNTDEWDVIVKMALSVADFGNAADAARLLTASGVVGDEDRESVLEMLADYGSLGRQRARADAGDDRAASLVARKLAIRGDVEGLRARIDAGDRWAGGKLASVLMELGRGVEAERVRRFGLNPDGSIA